MTPKDVICDPEDHGSLVRRLVDSLPTVGLHVLSGPPGSGRERLINRLPEGVPSSQSLWTDGAGTMVLHYAQVGDEPRACLVAAGVPRSWTDLATALKNLGVRVNVAKTREDAKLIRRLPALSDLIIDRREGRLVVVISDKKWDAFEETSLVVDALRQSVGKVSLLVVCEDDCPVPDLAAHLKCKVVNEWRMTLMSKTEAVNMVREHIRGLGSKGGFARWDEVLTNDMIRLFGRYTGLLDIALAKLEDVSWRQLRGLVTRKRLSRRFGKWIAVIAESTEVEEYVRSLYSRLVQEEKRCLAVLAVAEVAVPPERRRLMDMIEDDRLLARLDRERLLVARLPAEYRIVAAVIGRFVLRQTEARDLAREAGVTIRAPYRFDQFWFLLWWVAGGLLYAVFELVPGVKSLLLTFIPALHRNSVVLPVVPPLLYMTYSFGREAWDRRRGRQAESDEVELV